MRLELIRPNGHHPLKVACLPIPPYPQTDYSGITGLGATGAVCVAGASNSKRCSFL